MQKVGPSRISSDDQVWVVVTKVFPSATGLQILGLVMGEVLVKHVAVLNWTFE